MDGLTHSDRALWSRWVLANAAGELLGLGATFALGAAIIAALGDRPGIGASLLTILLMTFTGVIEGVVVGLFQWSALRGAFPRIARRAWVAATVIGALIAWFLGSLPSTMLSLGDAQTDAGMGEPSAWVTLVLASAMGLLLGVILGAPQYRVLRRQVQGAWIWLPANALAWSLGMPLIFAGVDWAMASGSSGAGLIAFGAVLTLAGAAVGAVHGAALVWLRGSLSEESYA